MATVTIEGIRPEQVDVLADANLEQIGTWARDAIDGASDAKDADELAAMVKSAWWEHEADFEDMTAKAWRAGSREQRASVLDATTIPVDLPDAPNVPDQIESLMSLGEWLAKQAVKVWNEQHPEAVAAAEGDPEERFAPVAAVTVFTITAMMVLGGSEAVMYALSREARKRGLTVAASKTWHTQQDAKVRDSHRRLQGDTVDLRAKFGNGLDHPSDRNGEPAAVFNCRCWLTYDVTYGGLGAAQGGTMGTKIEGILTRTGPDTMTGDARAIDAKAITWDAEEAPWPLKFDRSEGDHTAAIVGQIDELWWDGNDLRFRGAYHDDSGDPATQELALRAIELTGGNGNPPVLGVSVELDSESVEYRVKKDVWDEQVAEIQRMLDDQPPVPEDPAIVDGRVTANAWAFDDYLEVVTSARFRGAALVDTAAFNDAKVSVMASIAAAMAESPFVNPNFGVDGDDDPRLVAQTPNRPEETNGWGCPLTVEDDGRIYGHVALKTRCHGAYAACVMPPDSGGDYSYFLTGEAERGTATGPIIMGTTHGVTDTGRVKSHDHLADTGFAVADVVVGHDRHGMWCAGRLRPGVTEAQIAELRGSTLSGEWHAINGKLRLVGILAVNSPGFLVQRQSLAASFTVGASCCEGEDPAEMRIRALEKALVGEMARSV